MNRRLILIFALLFANALTLFSQEKPAAPKADKGEKPSEKSKPLIFRPGALTPAGAPNSTGAKGPFAQNTPANPVLDGPAQIVATFFSALQEGKIDEGYATLTKGSKIAEKPEELRQLKTKTREAIEVFGNIRGFDFVDSKVVGLRLVRTTYVSLGKVFPLRWRFYFYKTDDVWRLIDMRVDDKLTGIFDEPEEAKPVEPAPQQ